MEKKLRISASRLKVFLGCRWEYFAKYVLKLPDAGNDKARLGNAIHTIYECLTSNPHRSVVAEEMRKNKYLTVSVLRLFKKLCKKKGIIAPELLELGEKMLLNGLVSGFDIGLKVLATELEFEVDLGDNISTYGFVDKIQEVDQETLEVVDHKTGTPYSVDDCQNDLQVYLYLHAMRLKYPKYKNYLFSFHFTKNRKNVTVVKSKDEIDNFMRFVKSQAPLMRAVNKNNAPATMSFKCRFCSYKLPRKAEGYFGCPSFYAQE